jgi:hypothetical protein
MQDYKNSRLTWCERHADAIQVCKMVIGGFALMALGFALVVMVFIMGGGYNG